MPQEFQVLRCFSCQIFQVHQVKKAKKWNCKVCGEKQSILKVFGCGTGVECRGHTQKLNRLQGEARDVLDLNHPPHKEPGSFEKDQQSVCSPDLTPVGHTSGRWSHYMEDTNGETDEENLGEVTPDSNAFTTDWNQYKSYSKQAKDTRKSKAGKRKAYGQSELDQTLSESHTARSNCHGIFGKNFNKRSRVSSSTHGKCDQLTAEAKNPEFSSESHSFNEYLDSGNNKEMKISHSEHANKSTVNASSSYQYFTNKPPHGIQSESVNKFGVRKGEQNKFTNAKDTANRLNTSTACVLNEVNTMSNSTTEIFSRTIKKQNVNCELKSTGLVPKKKTSQQNSDSKRTVSTSKWGKFLSCPQESSDECSEELEFDQQLDKHWSKTAVSITSNSAEPLSFSDSVVKTCLENTMQSDPVNDFDVPLSLTCSKVATNYDEFSRKSDVEPNVQNLFSLHDSDEGDDLTFDL